jgi:hypothetical protein
MHRASVPLITTLSNLFRRSERAASRHRMQRAARIYAGKQTFWDKLVTYPDKGWALMILIGVAFVFTGVGYAACLVAESAVS